MSNISTKCVFRIVGLSDKGLLYLEENYLNGIKYRKGRSHKDESRRVLVVILDKNIKANFLQELIQQSTDDIQFGFLVSASSNEETVIIDIPEYLLDLQNVVGGTVSFSYTCI
ncbi:hypothetical protein [Aliikangiella maris]|uniref:Uncharacterized protein n=2 Tax=Aliikangiella maris TaxID=3162458 RepID=A0ABV3MV00_9GAMM